MKRGVRTFLASFLTTKHTSAFHRRQIQTCSWSDHPALILLFSLLAFILPRPQNPVIFPTFPFTTLTSLWTHFIHTVLLSSKSTLSKIFFWAISHFRFTSQPLIPPVRKSWRKSCYHFLSASVSCPAENCHHSCPQPLMPLLSVFKGVITPLPVPVVGAAPQGAARLPERTPYMAAKWRRGPGTVSRLVVYFSPISLLILAPFFPSLSCTLSSVLAPSSGDTSKNKQRLFLLPPFCFSAQGEKKCLNLSRWEYTGLVV